MGVQSSTKSYQLQEGGKGAKQPPHKGSAPGSRWGLRPHPPSYRIYGWMTDKNVGSNLPLMFKLHKIWSVDSQNNH